MQFVPLSYTLTSEQSREPLKERVWKYNITCENTRKRNLHGKMSAAFPTAILLFLQVRFFSFLTWTAIFSKTFQALLWFPSNDAFSRFTELSVPNSSRCLQCRWVSTVIFSLHHLEDEITLHNFGEQCLYVKLSVYYSFPRSSDFKRNVRRVNRFVHVHDRTKFPLLSAYIVTIGCKYWS